MVLSKYVCVFPVVLFSLPLPHLRTFPTTWFFKLKVDFDHSVKVFQPMNAVDIVGSGS